MRGKLLGIVVGVIGGLAALALLAGWGTSGPGTTGHSASTPPGFYPPAPSTAVGMTTEWRSFADSVDRICAVSFNYAMSLEAQTKQVARAGHWSDARAESAVVSLYGDEDARIGLATDKLGPPPEKPGLFARWRANVARRTALFYRASAVAGKGRFGAEGRIFDEIDRLKTASDKLGQRFGLQICTSN
jgi:hypothetical protein